MKSYLYELRRKVLETFEVEIFSDHRPTKEELAKAVEAAEDPHTVEMLGETVKLKSVVEIVRGEEQWR